YLAHIVRHPARAGIATTIRGQGGDVTIAKPAEQITLAGVCHAIDDIPGDQTCLLATPGCASGTSRAIGAVCAQYRQVIAHLINETTVDAFIRTPDAHAEPPARAQRAG
ncbi:MAG: Rrf2 family transcriptional regulator, partial [Planctomycetota bacterium]